MKPVEMRSSFLATRSVRLSTISPKGSLHMADGKVLQRTAICAGPRDLATVVIDSAQALNCGHPVCFPQIASWSTRSCSWNTARTDLPPPLIWMNCTEQKTFTWGSNCWCESVMPLRNSAQIKTGSCSKVGTAAPWCLMAVSSGSIV